LKPEEQKRHRLSWSGQSAKLSQWLVRLTVFKDKKTTQPSSLFHPISMSK
jgi:hypothetical protein